MQGVLFIFNLIGGFFNIMNEETAKDSPNKHMKLTVVWDSATVTESE